MTLPKTPPSFRLDGKRALVAGGASSGIGLACAAALGEAGGAEVTVAARRIDALEALVAEMTAAGMHARAIVLDVSDVAATRDAIEDQGPFDVLVNSAGLARHSPATETSPDDFDAVSDLNIKGGAYFLTQAVAKGGLMAAGKRDR